MGASQGYIMIYPIWIPISGDTKSHAVSYARILDLLSVPLQNLLQFELRKQLLEAASRVDWIFFSCAHVSFRVFSQDLTSIYRFHEKWNLIYHDHFGRESDDDNHRFVVRWTKTSLHSFRDIPSSRISRSVSGRAGWICQNSGMGWNEVYKTILNLY